MYAETTTAKARRHAGVPATPGHVTWYKAYARRKWRTVLLRFLFWGTALALAASILAMAGS